LRPTSTILVHHDGPLGVEGVVAKPAASRYRTGRSGWLKWRSVGLAGVAQQGQGNYVEVIAGAACDGCARHLSGTGSAFSLVITVVVDCMQIAPGRLGRIGYGGSGWKAPVPWTPRPSAPSSRSTSITPEVCRQDQRALVGGPRQAAAGSARPRPDRGRSSSTRRAPATGPASAGRRQRRPPATHRTPCENTSTPPSASHQWPAGAPFAAHWPCRQSRDISACSAGLSLSVRQTACSRTGCGSVVVRGRISTPV
jgi:hypothetical protein